MARRFDFQYYCSEGFHSIFTHGFMSFAAVCMIVACLLIMGSFSLVAVNLNHMLGDYTEEEARALQSQIEAVPNVGQVAFVTRAEALDDFRAGREDNPLLADLPDEVLRDRFEIHVDDIEQLQTTSEQVDEITGIADVNAAYDIAQGFVMVRNIAAGVAIVLVTMLAVVATNAFIRWPFVVEGMILGMTGALVAFFAQWGIYELVSKAIIQNNGLSLITVLPFTSLAWQFLLVFIVAGLLIGVVGSVLAIRKFLQV